ncbi:MAG: HlyD family type I secretion periplasmic adaptor subunit [Pseudomonadota bacterium]
MRLHLAATRDLLGRYLRVFRHVWRQRKDMDGHELQVHEVEFLPAALALRDTPVHPAPRVAMGLLVAFAGLAVLWAFFGHIDIVASAQGKLIPDDRTKVIQPMETAAVSAIHVRDGQQVAAGDLLIELDATATRADSGRITADLEAARLEAARARALLAGLDTHRNPVLAPLDEIAPTRLADAQRQLDGQYAELQARLEQLDAEIARREAELRATRELVAKLAQTVPIARQRARDYQDLLEKNFISRHGYLEKEQERIEQEGDLAAQQAKQDEIQAALSEGRKQRAALVAETRRLTLDTLNLAEQKSASLAQELLKATHRDQYMRLSAPVGGTVQQLAVHTVGGVVTPAQPLMVIVPADNTLEVEAFVENKDIGFVHAGQAAEVKVETFPFTKYGTLDARVIHVSDDAIQDEKRGLVYAARVKLSRATLDVDGKAVRLTPGMAVTAEIKTGKRRIIQYFLSPLMQYGDESLRER